MKITKLREERNLTQRELAQKLNITPAYMSYIENGRRQPSYQLLNKMIEVLGQEVVLDYLPNLKGGIKNDNLGGTEKAS